MKASRVIVGVLLCLALPLQGAASLRMAATPCPAMNGGAAVLHGGHAAAGHDGCQSMPCSQDQQKDQLAAPGCDTCAHCMLSPTFLALAALPGVSHHPQDLVSRRHTPALHPLALFAIWRPPATP